MNELDYTNEERAKLLGSLLLFTRVFFQLMTNREFVITKPTGRESHCITLCKELSKVFRLQTNRLIINIPPGHYKSTFLTYFVAWAFAHYPDCQFIYVSYSHELAAKHTANINAIMRLPQYVKLFRVELSKNATAKDNFRTTAGGSVKAFGSSGAIVGQDAGMPHLDRFSGCVLMDDLHKPDEVHSDVMREGVIQNYNETIKPRPRGNNVPMVYIGQRLHEDDLPAFLLDGKDGFNWDRIILKALDDAGNVLCPEVISKERLEIEERLNRYVYWSQYQQIPQPPGGALFSKDSFLLLDEEPEILMTFIVGDTAETEKTYNDPSVFTFFGLYKIKDFGQDVDRFGLHVLNCWEEWVEPKDLVQLFTDFYVDCMRHPVKPLHVAIEKKSTGTSLISTLRDMRGITLIDIERHAGSGAKTKRFIDAQPYISSKLISFTKGTKHSEKCIDHMSKITANNTHKHDDIADTFADAIRLSLIDKVISCTSKTATDYREMAKSFHSHSHRLEQARQNLWR